MAKITLKGQATTTSGDLPKPGTKAPGFRLVTADLKEVTLADYRGRKKLLNIVPSLDTPVCALSTRKFNDFAKAHPDTVVLVVSADLPFAQSRFCSSENTKNVVTLSMMRGKEFAQSYGVLITDGALAGLTARAVVVLDAQDQVIHTELVPEIADEPDYQRALAALAS